MSTVRIATFAFILAFGASCSTREPELPSPPVSTETTQLDLTTACNCQDPSVMMQFNEQTDRAVAAWLDRYEPFHNTINKQQTRIYFQLLDLRSRGKALAGSRDVLTLCRDINLVLLDIADWHYSNPRPYALLEGIVPIYMVNLGKREWARRHVNHRVPANWANFVWSDFGGRHVVFLMRQWVDELGCEITADRARLTSPQAPAGSSTK